MIDSNFEAKESRWQDIYNHLKQSGFDVYSPGIKVGECIKPYVVVKHNGASKVPEISTNDDLYSVMCYVPKMAYSGLEPMVQSVKKAMKEIEPMIMPYDGQQTPSFYDDGFKAHMISIEYKNHKKML